MFMNIEVRLLSYASKKFTYSVPLNLQEDIASGVLVQVPLKNKVVAAVVEEIVDPRQTYDFEIKSIISVFPFSKDEKYFSFIGKVAHYYQIDQLFLQRRLQMFLAEQQEDEL